MLRFTYAVLMSFLFLLSSESVRADGVLTTAGGFVSTSGTTITEYGMRQITAYTLTSTTSDQALFAPDRDTATMVSGVYRFNCVLYLDNMSATSGNAAIKPLGAGTATITTWLWCA